MSIRRMLRSHGPMMAVKGADAEVFSPCAGGIAGFAE